MLKFHIVGRFMSTINTSKLDYFSVSLVRTQWLITILEAKLCGTPSSSHGWHPQRVLGTLLLCKKTQAVKVTCFHWISILHITKTRWPHGYCTRLGIERSRVRALARDTVFCSWTMYFYSHSAWLSPPRCINGYQKRITGVNSAMDQHAVRGE